MNQRLQYPLLGLAALLLLAHGAIGQTQDNGAGTVLDIVDPKGVNNDLYFHKPYPHIEGSPYFAEDWLTGNVYPKKGRPILGLPLHFDLYSQEVLVKQKERILTLTSDALDHFVLYTMDGTNPKFIRNPMRSGAPFVQSLHSGDWEVWKEFSMVLSKQENTSGGYGQAGNSQEIQRFVKRETWYIQAKGQPDTAKPFDPSKKGLLGLFPEQEAALKKFVKKNSLNLKDDAAWKAVFEFLEAT